MRQLASIQRIKSINPIDNADQIEVATVLGWHAVVEKSKHKAGDLIIFFEIDSFLPIKEEFEFLRSRCYKKMDHGDGFRLKTIRLRKQVSQGLVMPLSIIPDCLAYDEVEGYDLTEALGVIKYERPIPATMKGTVKGSFPGFMPKSDETRCLSEGTILQTDLGLLTIKELCEKKLKCKVLSNNIATNKIEFKDIISHNIDSLALDWYEIKTENKTIKITGNHLVWLPKEKQYKRVDELMVGDILETN